MSTSEIAPGDGPASSRAAAFGPGPSPAAPGAEHALELLLERLANEYLSGVAGPALELGRQQLPGPLAPPAPPVGPLAPPLGIFPAATALGAGGISPGAGWIPPTPGALQSPPIASGPIPKESDLRTLPAMLSEGLGVSSPVGLARGPEPSSDAAPYFVTIAGLPKAALPPSAGTPAASRRASPIEALPQAPPGAGAGEGGAGVASAFTAPRATAPASSFGPNELTLAPSGLECLTLPATKSADPRQRRVFDPVSIRSDFPILKERVHGRELIWFDNAATTQKPRAVIGRVSHFYEHENSNIHRAAHALAARATDAYEGARETIRRFLNAPSAAEIIFARGTTEAINLVAQTWGRRFLEPGDEVVITWLEHHANIVPWQQICCERGARLRVAPVDDDGQVLLYEYEKLLGSRTKLVSMTQVSNALGTIVPVTEMTAIAHRYGAKVLVDGAQAVSHMPVDVQAIGCDFYVFSGHKIFGPTGIGALFGKADVLETVPPWQGGGNMIRDVTFEKTQFQGPPARFEAGTPNIADAVGLGAALDYVSSLGLENIARYEHELLVYATERLLAIPGLRLYGTAPDKAGVLSFTIDGLKTEDIGVALDREGIAVRAGHHCAQPILRRFGQELTVRASLAPYNTYTDVDALVAALSRLRAMRY